MISPMKSRSFNSHPMPLTNEIWASQVLGIPLNPENGPDLLDEAKLVEVKFNLIARDYPKSWTVQDHQMQYPNELQRTGYWGLGNYWLRDSVRNIKTAKPEELEKIVRKREIYIVHWSWMNQFPAHKCKGTKNGHTWTNYFRYPKLKDIPRIIKTYKVRKGLAFLTEGVSPDDFNFDIPF